MLRRSNGASRKWLRWDGPVPLVLILAGIGVCSTLASRCTDGVPVRNVRRYDTQIKAAADKYMPPGWDWRILKAMIRQESNFNPQSSSRVGALGLTQIMPSTADYLGVSPSALSQPSVSIEYGTKYLRYLWNRWPDLEDRPPDWMRSRFAIASYNAGYSRIRKLSGGTGASPHWDRVATRMPTETQTHIGKVFGEFYPVYLRLHPGRAKGVSVQRHSRLGFLTRLRARRTNGRIQPK